MRTMSYALQIKIMFTAFIFDFRTPDQTTLHKHFNHGDLKILLYFMKPPYINIETMDI